MRAVSTRGLWAVLATFVALLAAGCGDSGSSSDSSSATTSGEAPRSASVAFTQDNPGRADVDRSGETIKIGLTNDEVGAFSIPAFRIGAEQAVALINRTGGVNGARIELDVCLTGATPESAINCANKFIQSGAAAYVAGIDVGTDGAIPVLRRAGLPYISSYPWGQLARTDPIAHVLEVGQFAFYDNPLQVMRTENVDAVSAVMFGGAGGEGIVNTTFRPLGERYGIDVKTDFVSLTNPNWASSVQAASARGVGAILGYSTEQGCTQLVSAARQVSYQGLLFAGSCSDFIKALGDKAVGAYTVAQVFQPDYARYAPPEIQRNLDAYVDAMTAAGQERDLIGFAPWSFSTMMELRSILETIPAGKIDGRAIDAAFREATDTPGFLGPRLACAKHPVPREPTVCRDDTIALQVAEEGGETVRKPVYEDNYGFIALGGETK